MAGNHGRGGPPQGKGTVPSIGPGAPVGRSEFVPAPSAPLPRGFHPAPASGSAPQPAHVPQPGQPFPHPGGRAPAAQPAFVPAPSAPAAQRDFATSRTMTPAGELTAVDAVAPAVQATGGAASAGGWSRPSETPTQMGPEPSGVRSLSGDTGTGVMTGQTLGDRFRIIRKIGAGGMGEVWEAQHIVIKKNVAIKVLTLDPSLTNGAEQAERLMREARLVAAIQHDNVVDITDFGHTPMGAPYFVMELLAGNTLKSLIEQGGPVPWPRARDILMQITDALAAAHAAGIIHRDIKPENVFLQQRGGKEVVKLIDFGIAKTTMLGDEGASLTQTGMVCGTPAFMSPEQARGEKIDERTDIYSMGCLAYQMLAGRQPFISTTPAEALYQQLFVEPTPLREVAPQANIPANFDAIVLTCMRKNRNLRFQSMEDVTRALENLERTSSPMSVPREDIPAPPREVQTRFGSVAPVGATGAAPSPSLEFTDDRYDTGGMPAQRGSGGGLIVGILGGALVLGAGGGAAYWFLLGGGATSAASNAPTEVVEPVDPAAEAGEPEAGESGAAPEAAVAGETGAAEPEGEVAAQTTGASPESEPEAVAAGSGGRSGTGAKHGGAPVKIDPTPVFHDADHVADSQGPEEDDLPPPPPLPDADVDPEPEPEPAPPKPEPKPEPPKPKPKPKPNGKDVDDLRDPWERG